VTSLILRACPFENFGASFTTQRLQKFFVISNLEWSLQRSYSASMAIIIGLSTVSGLISLTIRNRSFLHALCRDGVHGKQYLFITICVLSLCRCTVNFKDLDGGSGRRCREHTELLITSFGPQVLWDEYGLVSNVVVRILNTLSFPC
jgi:hypothetical protein